MLKNQTMNHWSQNIWDKTYSNNPKIERLLQQPGKWKYFNQELIENIIEQEQNLYYTHYDNVEQILNI